MSPERNAVKLITNSDAETVAVDWAALIRAQKSDLCIDTRTKVTTGEIPKTTRPPNIHNPLREEDRPAIQNATRNRFPNPNVDETDAIKLDMWKGKSSYHQVFH